MKKLFLFDIEGTTTDINFVHKVLFPYSREKISSFLNEHFDDSQLINILDQAKKTIFEEGEKDFSLEIAINYFLKWIDEDRKHSALKELQGLIWEFGYKNQDFKGHLYPDVLPFFKKIKNSNNKIGIYSSGSVWAQKLLFAHSVEGDLTPFISYFFDTKVGLKRDENSYKNILEATNYEAQNIFFFSDIKEELESANKLGINSIQLERYDILKSNFQMIKKFSEFNF